MKKLLVALVALAVLITARSSGADDSTDTTATSVAETSNTALGAVSGSLSYALVDTSQVAFYDTETEIPEPAQIEAGTARGKIVLEGF